MTKAKDMVLGALVADAASLGLHWLYDQPRIAELAGATPEFRATTAEDFAGVPSYFAHPTKSVGDISQYGEQCLVLLRALAETGSYDQATYEAAFAAHFGPGGAYVGYIDHATRETLANLALGSDDRPDFPGAQDTQLPAVAKLPALIAAGQDQHVIAAIRTTNNCQVAEDYGLVASAMLIAARDGASMETIVQAGLKAAPAEIRPALQSACDARDTSTEALTAEIGMACELSYGLPSIMHNLLSAPDYISAVRRNILAGGDSCGRAMLLGAIAGVVHGVPAHWSERLHCADTVHALLYKLQL